MITWLRLGIGFLVLLVALPAWAFGADEPFLQRADMLFSGTADWLRVDALPSADITGDDVLIDRLAAAADRAGSICPARHVMRGNPDIVSAIHRLDLPEHGGRNLVFVDYWPCTETPVSIVWRNVDDPARM